MRRVRNGLDEYISPTQNAYRPGRGCQQHCVAAALLHQTAQKYQNYELHMLFVDFSKAYDSVDRSPCARFWNGGAFPLTSSPS